MLDELRKIRYARFRLEMTAVERLRLPAYKGSTFRGAFGHSFKQLVCVKRDMKCSTCLICDRCAYYYAFETPGNASGYDSAPHPYIFVIEPSEEMQKTSEEMREMPEDPQKPSEEPQEIYEPGAELQVGLVLVGRALDYLPYFIYSFEEMGHRGLGVGRGKVALQRVIALGPEPSDDTCVYQTDTGQLEADYPVSVGAPDTAAVGTRLRLRLHTPLRLKSEGRYVRRLSFSLLVEALFRRTSALARFHCGSELDLDYRQWIERAKGVSQQWIERAEGVSVVATTLRWHDWERFSQRQKKKMKLGGLVGEVEFGGEWGPFLPLLRLGADLHVGKATGFGLGRYEIL